MQPQEDERRFVTINTGTDTYTYFYRNTPGGRMAIIREIGKQASNPELDLEWSEASKLIRSVVEHREKTE